MKISRFVRLFGVSLMALALVSGAVLAQDDSTLITSISMVGGDLETIDPGLAQVSSQIDLINQMFIGLTHQNEETAVLEPGMASEWTFEPSEEGGGTYTFSIRSEVPWVHYSEESGQVEQVMDEDGNPRYVTAADFAYGMTRTLDPATGGAYAYVLAPYVAGGEAFLAGEGAAEDLGLEVVDDYTLAIHSPVEVAYAPSIYGLWMGRAVPQWLIEEQGDLWTEPENMQTYGPYTLMDWAHDESITIIANPFWPGTDQIPQPAINQVTFRFLDPQAQFAEFLAGTIDAVNVPLEEITRVKADPELSAQYRVGTDPCTYYVGFDTTEEPTSNANLRRALSMAIDRQSIVDNVTRGGQLPAQWFSRPGLTAAPTPETHPDLGIQYDPAGAQENLQAALSDMGLGDVSELPTIILAYNDAAGHAAIMQAIQQMWTETLGITVQLSPIESTGYFSGLREEAPMAFRAGWCQDYSDANNFLYEVYGPQSEFNYTGFLNDDYTALVEEARMLTDEAERTELYAQAEEILVDQEAAIAPIYWYVENQLTRPEVERTYSVTGNEYYYNWSKAGE